MTVEPRPLEGGHAFKQGLLRIALQLVEEQKQVAGRVPERVEGFNERRIPLAERRFIDDYLRGRFALYANIRLNGSRRVPEAFDYRAVFSRFPAWPPADEMNIRIEPLNSNVCFVDGRNNKAQSAVPVDVAKTVEEPNPVNSLPHVRHTNRILAFPIERLASLDVDLPLGVDAANLELPGAVVLSTLRLKRPPAARRVNRPRTVIDLSSCVSEAEFVDEVVKRVSEVPDNIAGSRTDIGGNGFLGHEHDIVARALWLELGNEFYGLRFLEGADALFEVIQMLVRPAELGEGRRNFNGHGGGTLRGMADSDKQPEPKQRTPKGAEIPVPKRSDVFRDLEKVAKGSDADRKRRPKK